MATDTPVKEEPKSMLEELQSWWEVVSIAQYVSLFREAFNLPEIEIEELENGLIEDTASGPSAWLEDLVVALMRSSMLHRVNKENWQGLLQKLVSRKCPAGQETPFPPDKVFHELGLRAKVDIIYTLCMHRLDKHDIAEVMKSMDADALRVQKLGVDEAGNAYWYFYGTRLYMEEKIKEETAWDEEWTKQKRRSFRRKRRGRPKRCKKLKSDGESDNEDDSKFMNVSEKSRWSVVCDTLEQWIAFAAKYQNSKSKNEKALFTVIQENFLPTLNQIYEEKEKKVQQKLKELLPIRERIVTRRETRKLRGEPDPPPIVNGYVSYEEDPKQTLAEDRARRLEERKRRLDEAATAAEMRQYRRMTNPASSSDVSSDPDPDSSNDIDEYTYALVPPSDSQSMDLQSQMERLISHIKLHKDAWPFIHPVNEADAPGYYEIIQDPIDLSSIESKLRDGCYETVGDLDSDFSQMVCNCEIFNGENDPLSKMAQTLWTIFRKGVSKILDSFPPEDLSNQESEENSNSSNLMYRSSHAHNSKKHKKEKKNKKKPARGMEALEMLAQASELAVQNERPCFSPPEKTSSSAPEASPTSLPKPQTQAPRSQTVPSQKRPCYAPITYSPASPSIVRTSLPVTSRNFVPVQASEKSKPIILRTQVSQPSATQAASTTVTCAPTVFASGTSVPQSSTGTFQTTTGTRTVPLQQTYSHSVLSGQNQVSTSGQSNLCLPGGGVIQKIIIPPGQPIQLQNGQQIILSSSQGAGNRVFSAGQRQVGQEISKMLPQTVAGAPVIQVSKEQLQRIQLALAQNASQGFSQVAQNAQIINIPSYMLSNQNQGQPAVMTMQQFQVAQAGQMNGQGSS